MDYTSCERDLGVFINERFEWQDHHNHILKKAYQMLSLTKRTCHFVFDRGKKRSLNLALVRSNFEHCSIIWRPVNAVDTCKFESLQKQAIKWIHGEEAHRYSDELYALRCKQAEILPLQQHFDLNDLLFFHKIVYNIIPVSLPNYISPYDGVSRQRASHLDHMSFVSISTLQCHYIKSIAAINFSNLIFTELYTHGTNYHLVFAKFPHTSDSSSKLKISCGVK